jgi:activating signal cointegrator complex subunit 2
MTAISAGYLAEFLRSYYHEVTHLAATDATLRSKPALELQRASFRLVRRIVAEGNSLDGFLDLDLIGNFCRAHIKSAKLPDLVNNLWRRKAAELQKLLQRSKDALIASLDSSAPDVAESMLIQLAPILYSSPDVAIFLMTGSDLVDSLVTGYTKSEIQDARKAIVMFLYLGLVGCVSGRVSNISMISDHLYSLKSQLEHAPSAQSVLADVVTNTPLIAKLRRTVGGKSPERLNQLFNSLETFRSPSIARAQRRSRRKAFKGKSRQTGHGGEMHMHRLSLVSQVQDLFPDLGSGFILRLLNEYGEDTEQVTAHLLDDSLPPHLQSLDRSEQAPVFNMNEQQAIDHLAPSSTPPLPDIDLPERRNMYDNDELDRLEFDTSRLHIGKKEKTVTSDPSNKAAILSALAAFDSDDDERDDTYDAEDVGGTIDAAHPDGEPGPTAKVTLEENESALFTAYKSHPEMFGRTFNIRRGQARNALKAETGMTDEAIEGWAIMLQRDPRRLKKLEAAASNAFDGKQASLDKTAYRESAASTETEDSDVAAGSSGERGGFRGRGGRGRGRGGRGRGGSVAGPSEDASTAHAQKRKEASKGSRANHNRRDQRAKKMARGGFPG